MKKLILAGITTALAGLMMAGPAGAQVFTYDVPANFPSPATGSYHVVFTTTSATSFDVAISGNVDGNTATNTPTPGFPAKHDADGFTFTFLDSSLSQVMVTGSAAPFGTPIGWTPNFTFGNYQGTANTPADAILAMGGNVFGGSITLANSSFKTVNISIVDGSQQWFLANASVVPEASSLALLLPGLAPLGLILRRRRQNRP